METLSERFGFYGVDMLCNAADPNVVNPDGAYDMEWPGELAVVAKMVKAGLLTRRRNEVTITDEGRAEAQRHDESLAKAP